METEHIEAEWLEKQGEVSVTALAKLSGLAEADLRALVDYGALVPIDPDGAQWMFAAHCVVTVQLASRLRRDFELDAQSLALALTLIGRIRELETELRQLRVLLPHRSS